ncbi:XdhC family protein [Vibrio sp. E150_011]
MQLTDLHILRDIQGWMQHRDSFWLCTILGTYGSSPRPVGSLFAWNGSQRLGSISGGCLEDAFIQKLECGFIKRFPQVTTYGKDLVDNDITIELPCGGSIKLLVEHYTPSHYHLLNTFIDSANQKRPFHKVIDLHNGDIHYHDDTDVLSQQSEPSEQIIHIHYQQVTQLLILGISQVSEWVAKLGLMAGFCVKICDMREELAQSWNVPATEQYEAVEVIWRSPDLFVEEHITDNTAVLALAHDPRIDDLGLMAALELNPFYVGAMGSKLTTQKRIKRLEGVGGIHKEDMKKLKAPIGLAINSKTPFEIAISVIADIIATKNSG